MPPLAAVALDRLRVAGERVEHAPLRRLAEAAGRVDALAEAGDDRAAVELRPRRPRPRRRRADASSSCRRRRPRRARSDGVGHRPAGERREQVLDGHLGHPLARAHRGRADVRDDEQVRRLQQRVVRRQRLGVGDVERGARDLAVDAARARSAVWSTTPPRAVLTRYAVGFIRASASVPIRWRVAGVSGQCSETKSARSSSSSSGTPERRELASTSMPKPSARRATASPIRPRPTIPSVAPGEVRAEPGRGLPRAPARPRAPAAAPSGIRRASASSSAKARSAVASVSTSGVLPTGMPRSAAASRSMLSVPTAMFAIAFRSGQASSSSASTRVGERATAAPRRRATRSRSVAGRRRQVALPDVDLVFGREPRRARSNGSAPRDEDPSHRRHHRGYIARMLSSSRVARTLALTAHRSRRSPSPARRGGDQERDHPASPPRPAPRSPPARPPPSG